MSTRSMSQAEIALVGKGPHQNGLVLMCDGCGDERIAGRPVLRDWWSLKPFLPSAENAWQGRIPWRDYCVRCVRVLPAWRELRGARVEAGDG